MTLDELKSYDGKNSSKAYVAYKNVVYDVSKSPFWQEGEHEASHSAGMDLTSELSGAPHGDEVFKNFPVVGEVDEEEPLLKTQTPPLEDMKNRLRLLYKKFHPHPMIVHFPIALHLFAAGLDIVFLDTPREDYAVGVFYSFFVATVMGFFAMIPGLLSWWINYNLSTHRAFMVKIVVSVVTLILGIVGIGIYLENTNVVYDYSLLGIIYHAIILFTGLNVIVLGYYGGKISWGNIGEENMQTVSLDMNEPKFFMGGASPLDRKYEAPLSMSTPTSSAKISEQKERGVSSSEQADISILIGGAAGLGIDTLEKILSDAFKRSGYYVFSTKEFMSRVRGGSNTTLIRIASFPVQAPCWEVDIAVALDELALEHMKGRYKKDTVVFADESLNEKGSNIVAVAMKERAKKFGDVRYANTYMAGLLFGVLHVDEPALLQTVEKHFKDEGANIEAAQAGYETGRDIRSLLLPPLPKADIQAVEKLHLMDGTTACGFGFLSGGCNMMTAYPMSPSTGVLNFMASMSKHFDIAVEQSEDEIASLTMVLGGWYGGARALTSTSGGGFALMGEALSLSGMTETPAVIYLAQRPGPATGLPTRSEQGDLNMAIYSGHGPFARAVLAPGSLQECIECGYLAFELADKYQIPVVVLSDQYLADSMSMIGDIDFSSYEQRRYIIKSTKEYERYADTESGISPRSVPGFGEGLVCAVGDEHDERGQITEDYKMREQMIEKRARKSEALTSEALSPVCIGEGDIAVIGWGSSKGAIAEALQRLDDPRLVQVHFTWVHPLSREQLSVLDSYKYKIVVENNADGAFADQLKLYGVKVDEKILQSNGFSFFADQLKSMIEKSVKELS
ncbi:2-oxoacid:acceptor oxidoreductase subunit alpha [Sulfurimonas sp. HSL-1716]|uniref:2-oxoacid:acceptor oxidoreductase subunit alpha n=1 Tax=Hydrocurvibacter sulfurireducens TaxID=3131937 RepID=UPI0031F88D52